MIRSRCTHGWIHQTCTLGFLDWRSRRAASSETKRCEKFLESEKASEWYFTGLCQLSTRAPNVGKWRLVKRAWLEGGAETALCCLQRFIGGNRRRTAGAESSPFRQERRMSEERRSISCSDWRLWFTRSSLCWVSARDWSVVQWPLANKFACVKRWHCLCRKRLLFL